MQKQAVVVHSGGMDSSLCLALAVKEFGAQNVLSLSFTYNQRHAIEQLDFYLTALSLSGTNTESCKNEDMADLIDELEDTVMDLDEYTTDENADEAEGEELKEMLLEAWQDFLRTSIRP